MFHGRPIFLPFSWPLGACDAFLRSVGAQALRGGLAENASPCVAERPGVTSGVTIGVTKLEKICPDFQTVKCQV